MVAIEGGSGVANGMGMQFLTDSGIAKTELRVIGRSFGIILSARGTRALIHLAFCHHYHHSYHHHCHVAPFPQIHHFMHL